MTPFGQAVRALALTCDDMRSLWSRSNLYASRCKYLTVWPLNPSQRKLIDSHSCYGNILANKIQDIYVARSLEMCFFFFFCDLRELARKLPSSFGHPKQVCTQVQLTAACDYLQDHLAERSWFAPCLWGSLRCILGQNT